MDKCVSRMFDDIVECFSTPCVCQCVECCDLPVWMMIERVAHEVTADKPCAARYEYLHYMFHYYILYIDTI
jgi:hypothetical protein